jgi:hypothetical protein
MIVNASAPASPNLVNMVWRRECRTNSLENRTITVAFDDRASDLGVYVIERGHQQMRLATFPGEDPGREGFPLLTRFEHAPDSGSQENGALCIRSIGLTTSPTLRPEYVEQTKRPS